MTVLGRLTNDLRNYRGKLASAGRRARERTGSSISHFQEAVRKIFMSGVSLYKSLKSLPNLLRETRSRPGNSGGNLRANMVGILACRAAEEAVDGDRARWSGAGAGATSSASSSTPCHNGSTGRAAASWANTLQRRDGEAHRHGSRLHHQRMPRGGEASVGRARAAARCSGRRPDEARALEEKEILDATVLPPRPCPAARGAGRSCRSDEQRDALQRVPTASWRPADRRDNRRPLGQPSFRHDCPDVRCLLHPRLSRRAMMAPRMTRP